MAEFGQVCGRASCALPRPIQGRSNQLSGSALCQGFLERRDFWAGNTTWLVTLQGDPTP